MGMANFLADASAKSGGNTWLWIIIYVAIFAALIYFAMIRPQKKQREQAQTLMNTMEVGDTVLTSSGFYGVLIDIKDDTVVVEFGNNKNCRIAMQRNAIVQVEKASEAYVESDK